MRKLIFHDAQYTSLIINVNIFYFFPIKDENNRVIAISDSRRQYGRARQNINIISSEQRQSCLDGLDYFLNLMESAAEHYYLEAENRRAYPIPEESLTSASAEQPEIEYGKKPA